MNIYDLWIEKEANERVLMHNKLYIYDENKWI
jgi:hypothetical protein